MNFIDGLNLEQVEYAIKAISAVHALSLGMKFKEKIDLNEKYSVKQLTIFFLGIKINSSYVF